MPTPHYSNHRASIFGLLFFIGCLTIMFISRNWWPGSLLVVGLPIALKQFLMNRYFDMTVSLVVFIGAFVSIQYDIIWQIILPVIFLMGGLYVILKEFFTPKRVYEDEKEEDLNEEMEEK